MTLGSAAHHPHRQSNQTKGRHLIDGPPALRSIFSPARFQPLLLIGGKNRPVKFAARLVHNFDDFLLKRFDILRQLLQPQGAHNGEDFARLLTC
jgi:hypothetical protein